MILQTNGQNKTRASKVRSRGLVVLRGSPFSAELGGGQAGEPTGTPGAGRAAALELPVTAAESGPESTLKPPLIRLAGQNYFCGPPGLRRPLPDRGTGAAGGGAEHPEGTWACRKVKYMVAPAGRVGIVKL